MRTLVLLPDRNTPGSRDWSGAFRPEATAFCDTWNQSPDFSTALIDCGKPKLERMRQFLQEVEDRAKPSLDCLAWFGHGLQRGLPQVGIGNASSDMLASVFASSKVPRQTVILYACSTGGGKGPGGDGGFADMLRDALCRAGSVDCKVYGHDRAGHATFSPYVRVFEGLGSSYGGTGGRWVIAPGSVLWRKWVKALRQGTLRFRYPFMTQPELEAELVPA